MAWLDSIPPNPPMDLTAHDVDAGTLLQWDEGILVTDSDSASNYVIYKFENDDSLDLSNPENILDIIPSENLEYLDSTGDEYLSYSYVVTALDRLDNESIASNNVELIFTQIEEPFLTSPSGFQLFDNYPNPFNPTTVIGYQLPVMSYVELTIYNLLGEKVVTLISENQLPGYHRVEWDASGYATGVYYYHIKADSFTAIKKMVLVK
jgi:hypothetical protein